MQQTFFVTKIDKDFHDEHIKKRDCFQDLYHYMTTPESQSKICALFGLRRTGKTVLMKQCAEAFPAKIKAKTLFITCTQQTDIYDVLEYMKQAVDNGYRYFFIDEITYAKNFQQVGEVLANVFVELNNARITVTGTESLGLYLPTRSNMYDRVLLIPTTYTSFAEYSKLTGCKNIDDYIKYGSTLRTDVFKNYKSAEQYVETAVVDNLIASLEKSTGLSSYPPALTDMYEKDVLRNAIQRIVNAYSQDMVVSALRKSFNASPLGGAIQNIARNSSNPDFSITQVVNQEALNQKVAQLLNIVPYDEKKLKMEKSHYEVIREFLKDTGVFTVLPVLKSYTKKEFSEDMEFVTHPGMFHANIKYVLDELARDSNWMPSATASQRERVVKEAYNFAAGRIMENCIVANIHHMLLGQDTTREDVLASDNRWCVSKLNTEVKGRICEADVLVYDKKNSAAYLFEIKHSSECVPEQSKHLENQDFLDYIEENFGVVKGRAVLYCGKTSSELAVPRIKVEDFLNTMHEQVLEEKERYDVSHTIKACIGDCTEKNLDELGFEGEKQ